MFFSPKFDFQKMIKLLLKTSLLQNFGLLSDEDNVVPKARPHISEGWVKDGVGRITVTTKMEVGKMVAEIERLKADTQDWKPISRAVKNVEREFSFRKLLEKWLIFETSALRWAIFFMLMLTVLGKVFEIWIKHWKFSQVNVYVVENWTQYRRLNLRKKANTGTKDLWTGPKIYESSS